MTAGLTAAKKIKKMEPSPTLHSTPNPSLPDELILSIVARVSRLYYPTLSLVSKSFRSLLASPELYKARSLLGQTESCLYVCLQSPKNTSWFTLCRKPDQTLANDDKSKKKSHGYVLTRVSNLHSTRLHSKSLVAIGSNIYNVAGTCFLESSSSVSILHCQSHTWHEAPSLREKLFSSSASVVDGKIYVAGSWIDWDSNIFKNSFEVFDTETQSWDPETITYSETKADFYYCKTACIDGKFHVMTNNSRDGEMVAYDSKEGKWDMVGPEMYPYTLSGSCQIENVLYSGTGGVFRWYDTKVSIWRNLKGLDGLSKFCNGANPKLADSGGKMAVLWEVDLPDRGYVRENNKMIWCAEIALERRKSCEIWGIVEWFGEVLTVKRYVDLEKVLVVTL